MADGTGPTDDSFLIEEITGETAQVARTLIEMGACEDCAIEAATDVVISMLAAEAPRVLAAYRKAIVARLAAAN